MAIAAYEVTPWVVLVAPPGRARDRARRTLEAAGCAVEVASDFESAVDCLTVMTPALIVIDDAAALPGLRDFLNRARSVRVEAARRGDVVSEQLSEDGKRDWRQLFGQARHVVEVKDLAALGFESTAHRFEVRGDEPASVDEDDR
jgi:hypothetical protein